MLSKYKMYLGKRCNAVCLAALVDMNTSGQSFYDIESCRTASRIYLPHNNTALEFFLFKHFTPSTQAVTESGRVRARVKRHDRGQDEEKDRE